MKEYAIKITETLEEVVTVEAYSVQEAKDKVQTACHVTQPPHS